MASAQEEYNELMRDKGRRTGHPGDDDDARPPENLSDDEDTAPPTLHAEDEDEDPKPSTGSFRSTIPTTRYHGNTGPKGVIADAQNWRDSRRSQGTSLRDSSRLATQTQSMSLSNGAPVNKPSNYDEDEDEGEELNDDFMQEWRESRLRELHNVPYGKDIRSNGQSKGHYGSLTTVDDAGYLEALENSPPDTIVVVYIYDDYSEVSTAIEHCLRSLAGKHQDVRFVRLHYEDAQMEPAGVPALLAYRGAEKFAGLVPMIDELPDDADLSASTVEIVLRRHQILR